MRRQHKKVCISGGRVTKVGARGKVLGAGVTELGKEKISSGSKKTS